MKTNIVFLKNVTLLFCFLMLFSFNNNLNAQIIYTDIIDATPSATYPLDLNNDNQTDFMIQFGGSAGMAGVMCYPQNNNAYAGNFVIDTYLPWALSESDNICDSLATWYNANNPGTIAMGSSIGNWVGATDKYLALKLIVGGNTFFGWARFDVLESSASFTIKDYAFESTPNTCIQAGQTSLGLNENSNKNDFSIFPNPCNSSTTIKTKVNLNNATITIYNAFGQALKQVKNISGHTISLYRENLPSGLYFIGLTEENKIILFDKLIISN
jgi:hypothetical protein